MEDFEKWFSARMNVNVEDFRIDAALLELDLQRIKIQEMKKQIKNLWIALLSVTTGCLIHLFNHLIFM